MSTIVDGIIISRRIFVRISNFITYRIAATLQLLVFFFIAVFAFKPSDFQVMIFRVFGQPNNCLQKVSNYPLNDIRQSPNVFAIYLFVYRFF